MATFAKVREEYQVHTWIYPEPRKGLLVYVKTGQPDLVSGTLSDILRLMNGRLTIEEIGKNISKNYEVTQSVAEHIVCKVVNEFVREGIVEISSNPMVERSFSNPIASPFHLSILQIQITNKCNLHCLHCYADSGKKSDNELATQDILKLIKEFSDMGGIRVFITGGEPLVHPDIDEIITYAKKCHLFVYLSTNGYAVTEKKAKKLVEIGVRAVNVSLDGCNARTHDKFRGKKGSFEKAIAAINYFLANNIICASHTTLFINNLDQSADIVNKLKPLGISDCFFVKMLPIGRGAEHAELIPTIEQYGKACEKDYFNRRYSYGDVVYPRNIRNRKRRCTAAVNQVYVDANGRCYPCPSLATDQFWFGKYPDSKLEEIWSDKFGKLSNLRSFELDSIIKCRECEHNRFCSRGCFGNALITAGDWRLADPHICSIMEILKRVQRTCSPTCR
jgi:radical SAM protein with 4Fe4S-binding SPASM domain